MALKIAEFLEKLGKSGKILMIDGSPKFSKKMCIGLLPQNFTELDLHQFVFKISTAVCFPKDVEKILRLIFAENSWENQVNKFTKILKDEKIYSVDYGEKMLNALANRIEIGAKLDLKNFSVLQKTSIKLVRASENSLLDIEEDFGLGEFTKLLIEVEIVDGNHMTILENSKILQNV